MMSPTTLWQSAIADKATHGVSSREWQASGVSIDTRTLVEGDLFVALVGPNFDGHDFVPTAIELGAAAIIAAKEMSNSGEDAVLRVDDTQAALEMLGIESRNRMRGKIIAVTGSVGKTSTKEMLKQALLGQGNVCASAGNLNNHWGLPLSLSRMPADTDFGIFEMGMNHAGEIRPLSLMAQPHIAIITAIEPVHVEHFNSVDEIADAKAEIFDGVVDGGYAVLNQDSSYFEHLSALAKAAGDLTVCGFGYHADAWARIKIVDLHDDHSDVIAVINGKSCEFTVGAPGEHLVKNAVAVLAAVFLAGGNIKAAAAQLAEFRPLVGRGSREQVVLSNGSFTLIDESYNASPASMRAAMGVVARIEPTGNGRRIAVLGDMLELGTWGPQEHTDLLEPLLANGFDLVFTSGPLMQDLWDTLPDALRGGHSISPEKLAMVIASAVRVGDVVMVKGSLGSRVGGIVEFLKAMPSEEISSDRK